MARLLYNPNLVQVVHVEDVQYAVGVSRYGSPFITWEEDDVLKVEYISALAGTRVIKHAYCGVVDDTWSALFGEAEQA